MCFCQLHIQSEILWNIRETDLEWLDLLVRVQWRLWFHDWMFTRTLMYNLLDFSNYGLLLEITESDVVGYLTIGERDIVKPLEILCLLYFELNLVLEKWSKRELGQIRMHNGHRSIGRMDSNLWWTRTKPSLCHGITLSWWCYSEK